MYQRIWDAAIGEVLDCDREPDNAVDHCAVKVVKDGDIVGHLPRTISRACSLFIRRGATGSLLGQEAHLLYELARTSKSTFSTRRLFLEIKNFREHYFCGSRSPANTANTAKISCSRNFPVLWYLYNFLFFLWILCMSAVKNFNYI